MEMIRSSLAAGEARAEPGGNRFEELERRVGISE